MEIAIRKLNKEDFHKGFFECLFDLFSQEVGLTPLEAEEILSRVCSNPAYCFFVAELEGKIVGAATLLIEQKFVLKGAKFGHLEDVAVREEYRRCGIGRSLVEALSAEAEREGCHMVRLDCTEGKRAFYEKCGFKKEELTMMEKIFLK